MLNIVIPMAGAGSRFAKAGYKEPKPFIDVNGKFMISRVIENIAIPGAKYIFICQQSHLAQYGSKFVEWVRNSSFITDFEIISTNGLTDGAACTVLLAEKFIDNNSELLLINSDQLVGDTDILSSVRFFEKNNASVGIMCFFGKGPKWSYVELNDKRQVIRIAEKECISDHANVGVYWIKKGSDFVNSAKYMIEKNIRVNNEFYVAPVFNGMIMDGDRVLPYFVNEFYGLGTPEDLEVYLSRV